MSKILGLYILSSADIFAKAGILGNLMSFVFNLSGAIMFQELMQTGGTKERRQLQKLQRELQSDDPINIQFTSVSYIFNTTSIVESTTCTFRSFLYSLVLLSIANKAVNNTATKCVMRGVKIK